MRTLSASIVLLFVPWASGQPVTFFDGTFNNSDWSFIILNNNTGVTPTASQVVGGWPGPSHAVSIPLFGPSGFQLQAETFSHRQGFEYNPSTQGAITSWSFALDGMVIAPSSLVLTAVAPAIRQNGAVYRGESGTLFLGVNNYTAPPPLPANYVLVSPAPPGAPPQPDFVNGGPIEFGFYVLFRGMGGSEGGQFDNFSISIVSVPEPSAIVLAGVLSAVGVGTRWRRRRK
jgi:hypothetical protein